jgi:hypothetical protein
MLYTIDEKKELFVVTLKGSIPEIGWKEFINYTPIIKNIEIGNGRSKKKQIKLTQLMTTIGKFMTFSSNYLNILLIVSALLSMISHKCQYFTLMKMCYSLISSSN